MINNEIPSPDPAWDYYVPWHQCQHTKAKIDEALKLMGDGESATPELDKIIHDLLDIASSQLIDIINSLESEDD
ncbi:MAG: hypothetical protein V7L00_17795 [Nostoc sp.]|uniref:hypothetical protein n=1 Tax=Nostoc sp. TaxID=1180 RepID=UPI002FFB0A38